MKGTKMASFTAEDHNPKTGSIHAGPLISISNFEIRIGLAAPGCSSSFSRPERAVLTAGPRQWGGSREVDGRGRRRRRKPCRHPAPSEGGRRPCLRACWDPAVGTPSLGLQCARTRAAAAPSYRPRDSSTRFVRGDTGAPAQDLPSHVSDTHVNPQRFL